MINSRARSATIALLGALGLIGASMLGACSSNSTEDTAKPAAATENTTASDSAGASDASDSSSAPAPVGASQTDELPADIYGAAIAVPVPDGWVGGDPNAHYYSSRDGSPSGGLPATSTMTAMGPLSMGADALDVIKQGIEVLRPTIDGFEVTVEPAATTIGGVDAAVYEYTAAVGGVDMVGKSWVFAAGDKWINLVQTHRADDTDAASALEQIANGIKVG